MRVLVAVVLFVVSYTEAYPAAADSWQEIRKAVPVGLAQTVDKALANSRMKTAPPADYYKPAPTTRTLRIVCPVLSALENYGWVLNADSLYFNTAGGDETEFVSKASIITSFIRAGLSHGTAVITANGNFNAPTITCRSGDLTAEQAHDDLTDQQAGVASGESCGTAVQTGGCGEDRRVLNLFKDGMNTLQTEGYYLVEDGPLEHFRSTGWRDTVMSDGFPAPNEALFDQAFSWNASGLSSGSKWNIMDIYKTLQLFDNDNGMTYKGQPGARAHPELYNAAGEQNPFHTSDTNNAKKCADDPANDYPDSANSRCCMPYQTLTNFNKMLMDQCFNQMYEAHGALFSEFGTPPNKPAFPTRGEPEVVEYDKTEYKDFVLGAILPKDFYDRSPKHCITEGTYLINSTTPNDDTCGQCWSDYQSDKTDVKRQRFCRCMAPIATHGPAAGLYNSRPEGSEGRRFLRPKSDNFEWSQAEETCKTELDDLVMWPELAFNAECTQWCSKRGFPDSCQFNGCKGCSACNPGFGDRWAYRLSASCHSSFHFHGPNR